VTYAKSTDEVGKVSIISEDQIEEWMPPFNSSRRADQNGYVNDSNRTTDEEVMTDGS
jgi:hypothetical protein